MKTKRSIFILVLLLALSIQVKSQDYIRLINDTLYWDVAVAEMGYICTGYSDVSTPWRAFFNGDSTTINGNVYYPMYAYAFIDLDGPPHCPPFVVDTVPSATSNTYFREDAVNKKVYKYEPAKGEERLLFDFSLNQGDTFHSPDIYGDILIDTVYQVITQDGIARKMLEFENNYGYMLEGIGGPAGPAEDPFYFFEEGQWLMCVESVAGENVFGGPCYDFLTGIESHANPDRDIVIGPNPFEDIIKISYDQGIQTVRLLNASGGLIKTINVNASTASVETSHLKPGMYFIEITTRSNQTLNRKLLKIKNR